MNKKNEHSPGLNFTVLHLIVQSTHAIIELNYVERVLPLSQIEAIPGSPAYLVGIMNLSGKSVPIIDLSIRLGIPRTKAYTLNTPLVLCTSNASQMGILVDEVVGLVNVDISELQQQADFTEHNSPFYATLPIQSELTLCLNIQHIMDINLINQS